MSEKGHVTLPDTCQTKCFPMEVTRVALVQVSCLWGPMLATTWATPSLPWDHPLATSYQVTSDLTLSWIQFFIFSIVRIVGSPGSRSRVRCDQRPRCGPGDHDPAKHDSGQLPAHGLVLLQLWLRLRRGISAPASVLAPVPDPAGQLLTRRPHLQMSSTSQPRPGGSGHPPAGKPFSDLNASRIHSSLSNIHSP